MRNSLMVLLFSMVMVVSFGQSSDVQRINRVVNSNVALEPLSFLSSDSLKGRSARRPEIYIAARYIAGFFRNLGIKEADSTSDYLQTFEIITTSSPTDTSGRRITVNRKAGDSDTSGKTKKGHVENETVAENVIGVIEGTDPVLKKQYIVLSAHYDHVGVSLQPKMIDGKADSIYNGARDNAVGVAAVMNAARYFTKHPPKRSLMFILYTGEELGMLGSKHFSEHPVVPLKHIVYNLNCDNAGYNDTTIITVVGLGRTSADNDIRKAVESYGLSVRADPVPELRLFDRSDNVNMAVHGVPAPTFVMGFTAFDSSLMKYYHQPGDEAGSLSTDYVLKYIRSYILAALYIANNPKQPVWSKDDKYEQAWRRLYTPVE